jgi:hypothetical protein
MRTYQTDPRGQAPPDRRVIHARGMVPASPPSGGYGY